MLLTTLHDVLARWSIPYPNPISTYSSLVRIVSSSAVVDVSAPGRPSWARLETLRSSPFARISTMLNRLLSRARTGVTAQDRQKIAVTCVGVLVFALAFRIVTRSRMVNASWSVAVPPAASGSACCRIWCRRTGWRPIWSSLNRHARYQMPLIWPVRQRLWACRSSTIARTPACECVRSSPPNSSRCSQRPGQRRCRAESSPAAQISDGGTVGNRPAAVAGGPLRRSNRAIQYLLERRTTPILVRARRSRIH